MSRHVAVLMGGLSAEREVSLTGGRAAAKALEARGYRVSTIDADRDLCRKLATVKPDVVYNGLHGPYGEDGTVQGLLEILGIPYSHSGVLASALAIDKAMAKTMFAAAGIRCPESVMTTIDALDDGDHMEAPYVIKPNREGSSLGVTRVETEADLLDAWEHARSLDDELFAERCIDGAELTIGILADETLPAIRLETPRNFYDYQAKYEADDTQYHCPTGLDPDLETQLKIQAKRAFDVLGCNGWGRVDLMLDRNQDPYFLEVNTVPGMTDHSLVPMAGRAAGMEFPELVRRILEASL